MKLENQQTVIEEELRKIIIKDDNFSENEHYIKLKERLEKFRGDAFELKKQSGMDSKDMLLTKSKSEKHQLTEYDLGYINVGANITNTEKAGTTPQRSQETEKPPKVPSRKTKPATKVCNKIPMGTSKQPAELPARKDKVPEKKTEDTPTRPQAPKKPDTQMLNPELQYLNAPEKKKPKKLKKRKVVQDTWQCSNCDFINDAKSRTCDVCNEDNTNFETMIEEVYEDDDEDNNDDDDDVYYDAPSDTWRCEFCTFENPFDVNICNVCAKTGTNIKKPTKSNQKLTGNLEPQHQSVSEPWACSFCTIQNKPNAKICEMCGRTKSVSPVHPVAELSTPKKLPPVAEPPTQKKLDWYCDQCGLMNPAESDQCQICGDGEQVEDEGWNCEFCTFFNHIDHQQCNICGKTPRKPKPAVRVEFTCFAEWQFHVFLFHFLAYASVSKSSKCSILCSVQMDKVMEMGNFDKGLVDEVIENSDGDIEEIVQSLIKRHLVPVIETLYDGADDKEIQGFGVNDPDVLAALNNKDLEMEVGQKIK